MRNELKEVDDGTFVPLLPMCIMPQAIEHVIFVAIYSFSVWLKLPMVYERLPCTNLASC
jgi:hypothetical protein